MPDTCDNYEVIQYIKPHIYHKLTTIYEDPNE